MCSIDVKYQKNKYSQRTSRYKYVVPEPAGLYGLLFRVSFCFVLFFKCVDTVNGLHINHGIIGKTWQNCAITNLYQAVVEKKRLSTLNKPK